MGLCLSHVSLTLERQSLKKSLEEKTGTAFETLCETLSLQRQRHVWDTVSHMCLTQSHRDCVSHMCLSHWRDRVSQRISNSVPLFPSPPLFRSLSLSLFVYQVRPPPVRIYPQKSSMCISLAGTICRWVKKPRDVELISIMYLVGIICRWVKKIRDIELTSIIYLAGIICRWTMRNRTDMISWLEFWYILWE